MDLLRPIPGLMPDPTALPQGCKFHPRCPYADERCRTVQPPVEELSPGHLVKCLRFCGGAEQAQEE